MRYFQKVIRRAEIPIAFSGGFSPHMIMSFASPLGLGVTSEGEYFDIEVTEKIPSSEAIAKMNATSVEGIEVLSFRRIPSEKKSSGMTILAGASYLVTFRASVFSVMGESSIEKRLDSFLEQSEISILKETKRSKKMVDIKPFIYELKFREKKEKETGQHEDREQQKGIEKGLEVKDKRDLEIEMTLAAGSKENLKPNLVMEALCSFIGVEYQESSYQYHRLEMFANVGDEENLSLVSLESLGEEIE